MAYEAYVRIMFNAPCLGNERFPDPEPNKMLRNADGNIVFLQVWWRTVIGQAAKAYNKHQRVVSKVRFSPEVDGTVKLHKRYYFRNDKGARVKRYKLHEAFESGDVIGVKALVPDAIPLDDFREILELGGAYYGISPFGWSKGYGRFKVVECGKIYGKRTGGSSHTRKPDVDTPGESTSEEAGGRGDDVQEAGEQRL